MKSINKYFALIILLFAISCFDHHDNVTIYKSGKIELVTTIVITNEEATKDKVKEELAEHIDHLKSGGWKVSQKWKKKSRPYRIEIKASNTLSKIYEYQVATEGETPGGVYIVKKFSEDQYVIEFETLNDANHRKISLSSASLPLYVQTEDKKVKPSRNIESNEYYYVMLD